MWRHNVLIEAFFSLIDVRQFHLDVDFKFRLFRDLRHFQIQDLPSALQILVLLCLKCLCSLWNHFSVIWSSRILNFCDGLLLGYRYREKQWFQTVRPRVSQREIDFLGTNVKIEPETVLQNESHKKQASDGTGDDC